MREPRPQHEVPTSYEPEGDPPMPAWMNEPSAYPRTVAELVAFLQTIEPETAIRVIPARSSGVSDPASFRLRAAIKSKYGYVLPAEDYGRGDSEDAGKVLFIR